MRLFNFGAIFTLWIIILSRRMKRRSFAFDFLVLHWRVKRRFFTFNILFLSLTLYLFLFAGMRPTTFCVFVRRNCIIFGTTFFAFHFIIENDVAVFTFGFIFLWRFSTFNFFDNSTWFFAFIIFFFDFSNSLTLSNWLWFFRHFDRFFLWLSFFNFRLFMWALRFYFRFVEAIDSIDFYIILSWHWSIVQTWIPWFLCIWWLCRRVFLWWASDWPWVAWSYFSPFLMLWGFFNWFFCLINFPLRSIIDWGFFLNNFRSLWGMMASHTFFSFNRRSGNCVV